MKYEVRKRGKMLPYVSPSSDTRHEDLAVKEKWGHFLFVGTNSSSCDPIQQRKRSKYTNVCFGHHPYLDSPAHNCHLARLWEHLQDHWHEIPSGGHASSPFWSVSRVPNTANTGTVCPINGHNQSTTCTGCRYLWLKLFLGLWGLLHTTTPSHDNPAPGKADC